MENKNVKIIMDLVNKNGMTYIKKDSKNPYIIKNEEGNICCSANTQWELIEQLEDYLKEDYNNCLKGCVNELIGFIEINENVTYGDVIGCNPITPNNTELREEFTDEHGFDSEDFITYLIDHSNDKLTKIYNENFGEDVIILNK